MIDLTLLGSGGGMPIPERYLSSLLISYKGRKILIDAGEGTQVSMREFHTGFRSLDIICISHLHGDHIFGLPGLLSTLSNSGRKAPITIIGPRDLKRILEGLLRSLEFLSFDIKLIENPEKDLKFTISKGILELVEADENYEDILISTLKLEHSSPCLAYSFYIPRSPKFHREKAMENNVPKLIWSKLQKGKTVEVEGKTYKPSMVLGEERKGIKISFVTDTRPIEEIVSFVKGSDLFVCEWTYGDDEDRKKAVKNMHMTFREAGKLAKKAEVKELVVTHFSAALKNPNKYKENAGEEFSNTVIGFDGYTRTLRYED